MLLVKNLLDNAIKYTPENRLPASISLRQNGAAAVLEIADNGCGMATDELEKITQPFYSGRSGPITQ